jgi:hypothetical protein
VGPSAALVAEEARQAGIGPDACFHQATVEEAIERPPVAPKAGDTWLFKASRGMALERLYESVRVRAGGAPDDPAKRQPVMA